MAVVVPRPTGRTRCDHAPRDRRGLLRPPLPDAYDALAPDVRWTSVGAGVVSGRRAVVDTCEATLTELVTTTVEFTRFLVVAADGAAAVDVVGRYVDADGATSVVSSCDVHEFREGLVTAITSCAVELEQATRA